VSMFFLLRQLGGAAATPALALAGAAVYAFLPVDVYFGTIWLQDTLFAGVLTFALLMLIRAADSHTRSRYVHAVFAGLALAYLQYLKETALLLIPVVLIWLIVARPAERKSR